MNTILQKIKPLWSVVCASSIVDKETNNMSLINLIENLNITIQETPEVKAQYEKSGWYATPINLKVVSHFHRIEKGSDLSFSFQMQVIDPNGKALGHNAEGTMAFPKDLKNMRMVVALNGLPVAQSGQYHVAVQMKDVGEDTYLEIQKIPLEVQVTVKK